MAARSFYTEPGVWTLPYATLSYSFSWPCSYLAPYGQPSEGEVTILRSLYSRVQTLSRANLIGTGLSPASRASRASQGAQR
jgi:hypothetical protein